MLELGVTPSHLSVAVEETGEGGEEEEEGLGGEEGSYCVPLESLGLGGNQITDAGVKSLVAGLHSNTSEWVVAGRVRLGENVLVSAVV